MRILIVLEQNEASRFHYSVICWLTQNTTAQIFVYNIGSGDGFKNQIVPVIGQGNYFQFNLSKAYWRSIPDIAKCLKQVNPDIVHAHMYHCAFYTTCAIYLSGRKFNFIYHRHNIEIQGFKERIMNYFAMRTAKKVIFVSDAAINYAQKKWPRYQRKFIRIYNGIDLNTDVQVGDVHLPPRYILLLGRLRPEKGHIFAIDAFKSLAQKIADVKLLFVGDGPYRDTITQHIHKNGLENSVKLIGHADDVATIIACSEFMIVPSDFEAFGLVAIEGMALKKMLITSNSGGLSEIVVNDQTGIMLDKNNPTDWTTTMEHYLLNPQQAKRLGEAGFERYTEHFTNSVMTANYFALYKQVLN